MNPAAIQFDLDNARACARACADAYRGGDGPSPRIISVPGTDTHCLVGEDANSITIAFRGSVSIRNWITDAEFERVTLIAGDGTCSKVHKGFNAAWNSILVPLFAALRPSRKPIFVTGHSLGGALAILAALALERNGFLVAQVYTFGQPRVGNGDFMRRYNAALGDITYRVVYQEDIVARIPHLPSFRDPYRHVGTEVFISSVSPTNSVDDLWFNPPVWRLLISDAWGVYRAWCISRFDAALDPAQDHHIGNYTGTLAAIHPSSFHP